jgi:hypothetical protein
MTVQDLHLAVIGCNQYTFCLTGEKLAVGANDFQM